MDETIEIKVTSELAGKRLDVVLGGAVWRSYEKLYQ